MALADKLKAQATQLGKKAQEAGRAGQAKLEELQARRHADALLRELGHVVFDQYQGRTNASTTQRIENLYKELAAWEVANGPLASGETPESGDDD